MEFDYPVLPMADVDHLARAILEHSIHQHEEGKCACDYMNGGTSLCEVEQWYRGTLDSLEVIEDTPTAIVNHYRHELGMD